MPVNACLVEVAVDNSKIVFSLLSFLFSGVAIGMLWRFKLSRKTQVGLMYGHLTGLFFPFVLFTTNLACGFFCLPCFESPLALVVLALPSTLFFAAIAGFGAIPLWLVWRTPHITDPRLTQAVARYSARLGISTPSLFLIDKAEPQAFSFRGVRSGVFLSVGLLELLTPKEQEAVLIHELGHIRQRDSLFKLSSALFRFSPFSFLSSSQTVLEQEEALADALVQELQGGTWLARAKRKVDEFSGRME